MYVSAVRPQSKHVVVLVDHGASVSETQLQIARDAALIILNSIDEHDKVRKFTVLSKNRIGQNHLTMAPKSVREKSYLKTAHIILNSQIVIRYSKLACITNRLDTNACSSANYIIKSKLVQICHIYYSKYCLIQQ